MRFGIGATSGMRPKLLRMRFRPVNDLAMDAPHQKLDLTLGDACARRPAPQRRRKQLAATAPPPGFPDGTKAGQRDATRPLCPRFHTAMPRRAIGYEPSHP